MKKMTILFTILCAGQLYGMEPEEQVRKTAEKWLAVGKSLGDTAQAMKNTVKGYDLKQFTELVHIFADKFNRTTENVALLFNTPNANEYIRLGKEMIEYTDFNFSEGVIEAIQKGGDINYSTTELTSGVKVTPLGLARMRIKEGDAAYKEMEKILIEAGARQ